MSQLPQCPLIVIRSSVPPGTTDRLSELLGRPLTHMPAFLKESTALWDVLNPSFILIGSRNQEHRNTLTRLFEPLLVPVIAVSPSTSEMVKLTLNAYLHTLISFWNEIHLICERTEISSHQVGRICSQDPRVVTFGANLHGGPAGGRCLPKDLTQLISLSSDLRYEPDLLRAVQQVNHKLPMGGHRNARNLAGSEKWKLTTELVRYKPERRAVLRTQTKLVDRNTRGRDKVSIYWKVFSNSHAKEAYRRMRFLNENLFGFGGLKVPEACGFDPGGRILVMKAVKVINVNYSCRPTTITFASSPPVGSCQLRSADGLGLL